MDRKTKLKKINIQRKFLLFLICITTLFMSVGYASINSVSFDIKGTAQANKQEGIFITDYKYVSDINADLENSKIENIYQSTMKSNITLSSTDPNSSITYEITIHNSTDKPYVFNKVTYVNNEDNYSNNDIVYKLDNLTTDTVINSNATITFNITFHYNENKLSQNNNLSSYLNFYFEEYIANTLYKTITTDAVTDNIKSTYVNNSTGINFHSNSSDSNGKGKYILNSTINDKYPIYYYRGNVTDNNIKFAGYCWKIVRTTETGGIKIIYNGKPSVINNNCEDISVNSQQMNMSAFNTETTSPADVGYMYGTRYLHTLKSLDPNTFLYGNDISYDGSAYTLKDTESVMLFGDGLKTIASNHHYTCLNTTGKCQNVYYVYYVQTGIYYLTLQNGKDIVKAKEEMFSNKTSSTLKQAFDNFYSNSSTGLLNYSEKIEDTTWCNDRRTYNGGLNSKDSNAEDISYFYNYYKLIDQNYQPSLKCENLIDEFSLKLNNGGTSGYGNNLLDYPIGTLTVDELMLAGLSTSNNTSNYLNTGLNWWTLSPAKFELYNAYNYVVGGNGNIFDGGLVSYENVGMRPVVSLKNNVEITGGTGTLADPYIIK